MKWTKLKYSNSQINKVGDKLISSTSTSQSLDDAMVILNNWRSAHSFPLHTFAVRLKRVSKQVDSSAFTVRRLKRVTSILKKLKRDQTSKMKMSRMQDVGGCRAVLSSIRKVNQLVLDEYEKSGLRHKLVNKKDYIANPKLDGYRSIHLVYKYFSDKNKKYNGLLIEIQFRTNLQHYWATAVETVDHFTRQAIKSNEGEKDWKDFFKLVSSAFANIENKPIVPNTPNDRIELRSQIQNLAKKLKVVKKMNEWAKIHRIIEDFEKVSKNKFDLYLLNLNLTTKELKISAFKKSEEELANLDYSRLEESMLKNNEDRDIVLVSADTVKELRKAYPNYFLDAKEFINTLNKYFQEI
ncbi:MAG: RelA/SpoT domain-containing protein [Candidatus Komeilibacteria bacterium]|nr:RelA/SpoT domain-containing protein [Candidatus Komeilibacteria bacterium]